MDSNFTAQINSKIDLIDSLSVIGGYYLVLGGGKIGNKFVEYAKRQSLPFVLVIDIESEAPASKNAKVLSDRDQLTKTISSLVLRAADDHGPKQGPEVSSYGPEVYFYCMDAKEVPSLLVHGMPEYIVPAIPSHATVDLLVDFLGFDMEGEVVHELSIDESDIESREFFDEMVSAFPENIIAGKFPEHGAIFFSYARPGEICPDNCRGQDGYCYTFKRVKPRTVTSYVSEFSMQHAGWIFESYQMGPGIGGIRGIDLKENLISAMKHVRRIKGTSTGLSIGGRSFFIATTCNCHGILNLLQVI